MMTLEKPPTFSGVNASQDACELEAFVALLRAEGVRSYGEIGTLYGDTFHYVMSALPAGSKGVALDVAARNSANGRRIERALADLKARGYDVSYLCGNSQTAATANLFRARGPYDCILIDGDHSLVGVSADWSLYSKMARLVAFHDITGPKPHPRKRPDRIQVSALWNAIKSTHPTREIVNPGSYQGIGVAWCS